MIGNIISGRPVVGSIYGLAKTSVRVYNSTTVVGAARLIIDA